VGRIPGFTYKAGDDVRGFGGAAGNVLIDGERPSSKAVTLDEALKRIPVAQIERVELIRGGAPGIDMQGQSVVANVIRRKGVDYSLAYEHMIKLYSDHPMGNAPRLEGFRQIGGLKLQGAVSVRLEKQQGDSGKGHFVRRDAAGRTLAAGPFHANVDQRTYVASGSAEYDAFRLNVGVQHDEFPRAEFAELVTGQGVPTTEQTVNDLNLNKAEIGGDYQLALGRAVTARLIGLYTAKDSDLTSVSSGRGPLSVSTKTTDGSEAILRGTLRSLWRGMTLEAGGEAALNTLDVASSLTTGGVAVPQPSANVRVEEQRAEVFANLSAKLTPRLSINVSARFETSTIAQSGDVSQEKTLRFAKPRLALNYELSPLSQVRMRFERTVGQLIFEDFAASGDLSAGAQDVGNSDLEPQLAWESEVAWEQRFWGRGAIVVTATHSEVSQVSDVIPIVGTGIFDAPGNLGDGTRDELAVSLNVPFDQVRLKGLSLRTTWAWRRTRVTDPATGRKRSFSTLNPWDGTFSLSQDFPRLKSLLTLNSMPLGYKARQYRSTEIRVDSNTPYFNISWQYRPRPDLTMLFQYENFLARERRRDRTLYAGARSGGIVAATEARSAEMSSFIMMRARKTF
ncbi:MAG TPA: TonB-dependent receptor, partial [Phenylobacterium sp.]|nr:TonB-dependent receptor [Phenylobacterium sp.]